MAELDRLINIGRAYANKAKDSFYAPESPEEKAIQELNQSLESPTFNSTPSTESVNREPITEEEARLILGVAKDANFGAIKTQYTLLCGHLAEFKSKYPSKHSIAAKEEMRLKMAFELLSSQADATEKRFGSLEIE